MWAGKGLPSSCPGRRGVAPFRAGGRDIVMGSTERGTSQVMIDVLYCISHRMNPLGSFKAWRLPLSAVSYFLYGVLCTQKPAISHDVNHL